MRARAVVCRFCTCCFIVTVRNNEISSYCVRLYANNRLRNFMMAIYILPWSIHLPCPCTRMVRVINIGMEKKTKRKENESGFRYGLRFDMSYENCSFVELAKWCIHSDKFTKLDWLEAIFTLYDGNEERLTSSMRKKSVITTWHTIKLSIPYACISFHSFFSVLLEEVDTEWRKKRFTTSTRDSDLNDNNHIDNGDNRWWWERRKKRVLAANKCGLWMQFALPRPSVERKFMRKRKCLTSNKAKMIRYTDTNPYTMAGSDNASSISRE